MARDHLLRVRLSALAGSAVERMTAANGSSRSDTFRPVEVVDSGQVCHIVKMVPRRHLEGANWELGRTCKLQFADASRYAGEKTPLVGLRYAK
jgi:hypothetical protein